MLPLNGFHLRYIMHPFFSSDHDWIRTRRLPCRFPCISRAILTTYSLDESLRAPRCVEQHHARFSPPGVFTLFSLVICEEQGCTSNKSNPGHSCTRIPPYNFLPEAKLSTSPRYPALGTGPLANQHRCLSRRPRPWLTSIPVGSLSDDAQA